MEKTATARTWHGRMLDRTAAPNGHVNSGSEQSVLYTDSRRKTTRAPVRCENTRCSAPAEPSPPLSGQNIGVDTRGTLSGFCAECEPSAMWTLQGSIEAPWPKALFIVACGRGSRRRPAPQVGICHRVLRLKAIFNFDSGRKEVLVQPLQSMCHPPVFSYLAAARVYSSSKRRKTRYWSNVICGGV